MGTGQLSEVDTNEPGLDCQVYFSYILYNGPLCCEKTVVCGQLVSFYQVGLATTSMVL